MKNAVGFDTIFNPDLFSKKIIEKNKWGIMKAAKFLFKLLKIIIKRQKDEVKTSLFINDKDGIDFFLTNPWFSFARGIRIYSGPQGQIVISKIKKPKGEKHNLLSILRFLFLTHFEGDSAMQEIASNFKQIKAELFIAMMDNNISNKELEGLDAGLIRNIMDALLYNTYNSNIYLAAKSEGRIRNFFSRLFYLFNTNYKAYTKVFSDRLTTTLAHLTTEKDFMVVYFAYIYFIRMLQGGKRIDIETDLSAGVDLEKYEKQPQALSKFSKETENFIEYNIIHNFYDSIYKDILYSCDSHRGRIYHLYEKIRYSFEKKAYEDIYSVLKLMNNEGLIRKKDEYYLFYRIFAFSYYESYFPTSYGLSVTDIEKTSTRNRFAYISSFINRIVLAEKPVRITKENIRISVPRILSRFLTFGLVSYLIIFLLSRFNVIILDDLVEFLRSSCNKTLSFFSSFLIDDYGLVAATGAILSLLVVVMIFYVIYRLIIHFIAKTINQLKERHKFFYSLYNMAVFVLLVLIFLQGLFFFIEGFTREKLVYLTYSESAEATRDDFFVERFLHVHGIYARYDVEHLIIGKDDKDEHAFMKKISGVSKLIIDIDPEHYLTADAYITERISTWEKMGKKNLEVIFMKRFPAGVIKTFYGLPVLDRLNVKGAVNDNGADAIVVTTETIRNVIDKRKGNDSEYPNTFFWTIKSSAEKKGFIERLTKDRKNIKPEELQKEINISYYYTIPKTGDKKFIEISDDDYKKSLSPLTMLIYPPAADSLSAFFYRWQKEESSASISVLSIDEKYLSMESGFGDFVRKFFFTKEKQPAITEENRDPAAYAGVTFPIQPIALLGFLILFMSFLFYLMPVTGKKEKLVLLISYGILLAAGFFSLQFLTTPFVLHIYNIIMYLGISLLFTFYLCQVIGVHKSITIFILILIVPLSVVAHGILSFVLPGADLGAIYDFFIKGYSGLIATGTLTIIIGICSYVFFSFKFKIK
ncbi:MAG: hypothetical protein JXJ04_20480 [Spirochaetales bacterium]|nr:hypothetical protein [Spirochaetales bacterium]